MCCITELDTLSKETKVNTKFLNSGKEEDFSFSKITSRVRTNIKITKKTTTGSTFGILLTYKGRSGFMALTLLIPKQDLLMVFMPKGSAFSVVTSLWKRPFDTGVA